MHFRCATAAVILAGLAVGTSLGQSPLGTGFTYQGRLQQNGQPFTGSANLVFKLFDAPTGGNLLGTQTLNGVTVSAGLFTVLLDPNSEFGANAFNGQRRWLEVTANGTLLAPRQALTATPYAEFASAPWITSGANLSYTAGSVGVNTTTPLNRLHVVAGALGDGIRLTGGTGTDPGFQFFNGTNPGGGLGLAVSAGIWSQDAASGDLVLRSNTGNKLLLQSGAFGSALAITSANNVGIGTATPGLRLTVAGDAELGVNSADYHHFRVGGGNSSGFLYGSFPHFADGIHIGYNYYADAAGNNVIPRTDGPTSRISMGYGYVSLATGGTNTPPVDRLFVTTTGNVGIGTANPLAALETDGGSGVSDVAMRVVVPSFQDVLHLRRANVSTEAGAFFNGGELCITNNVFASARQFAVLHDDGSWGNVSDRRMKTDIAPAEGLLAKALALRPVEFFMKSQDRARDPQRHIGLIAQDVQPVLPSLVSEPAVNPADNGTMPMLSLNYSGLGVVAIGAIQEQQTIIATQQQKLEELRAAMATKDAQVNELTNRLTKLEAMVDRLAKPQPGTTVAGSAAQRWPVR